MRHNKTFKKGTDYEEVILWLQDIVKFEEKVIPGLCNTDHPDTICVVADDFNVSIMKVNRTKELGDGK